MNTPHRLILNLAPLRPPLAPAMTWPNRARCADSRRGLSVFYGWAGGQGLPQAHHLGRGLLSQPWHGNRSLD